MKLAIIDENACVGCTKCIDACPVDAIIGASKWMHTVLVDECIGCGLCVAPCPMDCISMVENTVIQFEKNESDRNLRAMKAKQRYLARKKRQQKNQIALLPDYDNRDIIKNKIKLDLEASIQRIKLKRQHEMRMDSLM